ncbi:hypothetical protein [Paenibacillus luteus]|uniref:hypothetical protein n=1 Tax=Paenibacillus luteus TaxID=2545753 RepID=UPI001144098B|nr:hypothetical protein [Paenibacillus luteus]
MSRSKEKKHSNLLIDLQLFLAVGALFGGSFLIIDPSGELMDMPLSLIEQSWFSNYFIPGLFLVTLFGVMPLIIAWGLYKQWAWSSAEKCNLFANMHWSWTFTVYSGIALILWITIQVLIIDRFIVIHFIYLALGIIIIAVAMLPGVQKMYKVSLNEGREGR